MIDVTKNRQLFAKRIKEMRLSLGYTQVYVCEQLGFDHTMMSHLERVDSKRIPNLRTLLKIALFYRTSLDYLTGMNEGF